MRKPTLCIALLALLSGICLGKTVSEQTQVRNLTAAMTDLVNGMASIWTGEAASAYTTKFNGLQDDISKINAMIQEHVNDLTQMASTYNSAEQASTSEAQGLSSDVIV